MDRRSLFGALLGGITGASAAPSANATATPSADHTRAERDADGKAICRVYREGADGSYREIRRHDVRPGDRIIMIGQDGDRLWKAEAVTALQYDPDCSPAGGVLVDGDAPRPNLLASE